MRLYGYVDQQKRARDADLGSGSRHLSRIETAALYRLEAVEHPVTGNDLFALISRRQPEHGFRESALYQSLRRLCLRGLISERQQPKRTATAVPQYVRAYVITELGRRTIDDVRQIHVIHGGLTKRRQRSQPQ
jgi:DNA-binding PadR family transcriptional regulator